MDTPPDETDDQIMTPSAFEFAIFGLGLHSRTIRAAYLVHVEGLPRAEAREKVDKKPLDAGVFNRALSRIEINLQERLKDEGLVMASAILTPDLLNAVEFTEGLLLESKVVKKKTRRKKQ